MRRALSVFALVFAAGDAAAAHCREGENESNGVCCPVGSVFLDGDCVTPGPEKKSEGTPATKTTLTIVPSFRFVRGVPSKALYLRVNGGKPQEIKRDKDKLSKDALVFTDIDTKTTFARVDVQGDEIYDFHDYVPVGEGRALTLSGSIARRPNMQVVIEPEEKEKLLDARVYVDCASERAECSIVGLDRDCEVTTQCTSVHVKIAGNTTVESKKDIALDPEGKTTLKFTFSKKKPSAALVVVPIVAATASIVFLALSMAIKDEGLSYGFLGATAGMGGVTLTGGSWMVAHYLTPRVDVSTTVEWSNKPHDSCILPGVLAQRSTAPGATIGLNGFALQW